VNAETAASTHAQNARLWSSVLLAAGGALVVMSVVLAISGTSRAVAAWVTPLALALLGAGVWGRRSRRTLPRWVVVAMAVAIVALVALGLWTLVYSLNHPPQSA